MIDELMSNDKVKEALSLLFTTIILAIVGLLARAIARLKKSTDEISHTVNNRPVTLRADIDALKEHQERTDEKVDTILLSVLGFDRKLNTASAKIIRESKK